MNKNSEQILFDITKMCKKYEIKRGMFLWLEKDDEGGWNRHRFILFEPGVADHVIHQFADLFHKCMKVSKTLMSVMEHMANHYLQDVAEMRYFDRLLKQPPKKKVVN